MNFDNLLKIIDKKKKYSGKKGFDPPKTQIVEILNKFFLIEKNESNVNFSGFSYFGGHFLKIPTILDFVVYFKIISYFNLLSFFLLRD